MDDTSISNSFQHIDLPSCLLLGENSSNHYAPNGSSDWEEGQKRDAKVHDVLPQRVHMYYHSGIRSQKTIPIMVFGA